MKLSGKTAIVTGAGRGIGRACALALAREGADVAVSARTQSEIDAVAREIEGIGRRALAVAGDVSCEEDVARLADAVLGAWGRVDVLVNNAGAVDRATTREITTETWDMVIAVNLRGTFLCTKAVLEPMIAQGWGRIVNISSGAGKRGTPTRPAYSAAKFGVNGFTEALDAEVQGFGVRAHVVCPGPVATQMRKISYPNEDQDRLIRPEDVADAVMFLVTQPGTAYTREIVVSTGIVGERR
jgi:NAD(P)-dependent dehydrogenase (short-subunit alcohol dehydrogenase family)